MNVNGMLDLASTKQTAASKPSKGNSKTSDTSFQSILGQKSQGRDTTPTSLRQQNGLTAADKTQAKPQTASQSDKPADINSDNSAKDVDNTNQPVDSQDPAQSGEAVEADAEVTETEAPAEPDKADTTTDTDDSSAPTDGNAVVSAPIIVIPGPIVATENVQTAGPMEMVAAPPVIQMTETPERIQTPQMNTQQAPVEGESAQNTNAAFTVPTEDNSVPQNIAAQTVATEGEVNPEQPVLEMDPELAEKVQTVRDTQTQRPQQTAADEQVTAADTTVDNAEHFAAQVVKEAKNLVQKGEQQVAAAPGEEEAVVREDAATTIEPVESKESSASIHEDADPEPQTKTSEHKEGAVHHNTTGTATVSDNGQVNFRMSGAQPLEAEHIAAPPEPPQVLMNKVVDQVRSVVTPDKTEFYVQLKPDHLGGLSIGLVAEDKGVVAKIMTSSQQVHAALQADMNQMVQMLRDKGINVVQMEVIYDQTANAMSQNQQEKGQQQFSQGHGRSHGRGTEQVDGAVSMYDTLSSYEVLTEQGGSVEFSA